MKTSLDLFDQFAKHNAVTARISGQNAVIYTRVSTKEQADNNLSLETQLKACELYASRHDYTVLECFGGTYESAKTDERNQFKNMIAFARRNKVSYIIVYSLERFSRNDNAIWLARQLRETGIQIISVTQPIDTTNPSGVFQQNILFLFGQYDNDLRRQKCMAGTKEKLLQGYWVTKAPLGYDQITKSREQKIYVNEKGKLLRKAFYWKAEEGLSTQQIIERLKAHKMIIYPQRMSEIFRNPFYCGLLSHKVLDGKVVEGKHEPLVSRELFLKANGILQKNHQKYHHKKENNELPLKRFVKCGDCGTSFAGYVVKKKNLYYYKCNRKGCKCNKSAKELHKLFSELLQELTIEEKYIPVLREQLESTFHELTESTADTNRAFEKQLNELDEKIELTEEGLILREITRDLYEKYILKYKTEKKKIIEKMEESSASLSNLPEYLEFALSVAPKLNTVWELADFSAKEKLQYILFSKGISYDREKGAYRTDKVHSMFLLISYLSGIIQNEKSGINNSSIDYSAVVAGEGLEPTTPGL